LFFILCDGSNSRKEEPNNKKTKYIIHSKTTGDFNSKYNIIDKEYLRKYIEEIFEKLKIDDKTEKKKKLEECENTMKHIKYNDPTKISYICSKSKIKEMNESKNMLIDRQNQMENKNTKHLLNSNPNDVIIKNSNEQFKNYNNRQYDYMNSVFQFSNYTDNDRVQFLPFDYNHQLYILL
jgi:hypothetical protein